MEQVISLINKLELQVRQGAPSHELLATTAAIKTKLEAEGCDSKIVHQNSVAVWLPSGYKPIVTRPVAEPEVSSSVVLSPMPEPATEVKAPETPVYITPVPKVPVPPQVIAVPQPAPAPQRQVAEPITADTGTHFFHLEVAEETEKEVVPVAKQPEPLPSRPFPQYPDAATLIKNIFPGPAAPKPAAREINEMVAEPVVALNQKLHEKKVELAEVLATGPKIADLRKAISINEKYQLINSLFRSDEDMFERSVRTLNNFGSLPEARFWMQRELVVKLGWNDEDELVQHFYKLVSRRFS